MTTTEYLDAAQTVFSSLWLLVFLVACFIGLVTWLIKRHLPRDPISKLLRDDARRARRDFNKKRRARWFSFFRF